MSTLLNPTQAQEQWHAQRAKNVGASDVAALFGASPYTTKFTLWHQKAGKVARPDFDTERMKWGNRLEEVIAKGIAEDQGWQVRKVNRYITHKSVFGMGASLDFEIVNHPDGAGCFEIKNLSYESWKRSWIENEDGSIEAPIHIELQLQHQLAVTGRAWGAIGFLIAGNEAHVVIRKRHEPTIQKLEKAVADFWKSITQGQVPAIEDAADLSIVAEMFSAEDMIQVDSEEFLSLCEAYKEAGASAKEAEKAKDAAKVNLVAFLDKNQAGVAIGNGFKASYKKQSRGAYTVQASEFFVLRVSEVKGKA